MFAGIIEKTSRVVLTEDRGGIRRVHIAVPPVWRLKNGQSVAIDGVCSTIVGKSKHSFFVEYMPETLSKTTANSLGKNRVVNLERSLTLGSYVDGHLLQGHVDARATITDISVKGRAYRLTIALPERLRKFVATHGSIAINGVSLTVAAKNTSSCTVALIPYTLTHTNLGLLKKGDEVNIEIDLIARYLAALKKT